MARKKNPENKTREEDIREKLDRARQMRIAMAKQNKAPEADVDAKEAFRVFWTSARKSYDRPKELEEVLWAHLKASGYDKPELFQAGLEHFGLKK